MPLNSLLTWIIEDVSEGFLFEGLLANKTPTFTLLAGVCVFREEQLRPVQHVDQDRQLGLHKRAQAVLKGRHNVLEVQGEEHPDCCTEAFVALGLADG